MEKWKPYKKNNCSKLRENLKLKREMEACSEIK